MKISAMKVDGKKIETGAWVRKIPEMGAVGLKVRGFGNSDDLQLQKELTEAIPRSERVTGLSAKANYDIMTKRLTALLLDWEGVIAEDDKPLPFDKKTAEGMIGNPDFVRFRDAVIYAASVVGEAGSDKRDTAAKN